MPHVIDAGEQVRAEHFAIRHHAADRHATEIDTVVALLATDQASAIAFAARPVIAKCNFQRRID